VSDRALKRLPADQREGVLRAIGDTAGDWSRSAAAVEGEAVGELKAKGVAVHECDRAAFRARVEPLWDAFAAKVPGAKPMIDAVRATGKA
jgi:TRAP-type C4-dicarboxylate transport system substrate-binding protein